MVLIIRDFFTPVKFIILLGGLYLKKNIEQIIKTLFVNVRIDAIHLKGLSITFKDKDVPERTKVSLAEGFIEEKKLIKPIVKAINEVYEPLRQLITVIKNIQLGRNTFGPIKERVLEVFETLLNSMQLVDEPREILELQNIIQGLIEQLRRKPEDSDQKTFPSIDMLSILDPCWYEKDPREFQFFKELKKKL